VADRRHGKSAGQVPEKTHLPVPASTLNDKERRFHEIIELGKRKKFLTFDDINKILPIETNQDEIDELFDELEEWDIGIQDSDEYASVEEKKVDMEEVRNPLRSYLKGAGSFSLLTHAQEVEIARGIEEAKKRINRLLKQNGKKPSRQLMEAEERLNELRGRLIQANLRLVINIAKRYSNPKLSILDLIQEGNIGLMKAVEKFKYRTGFKFSTYATWWIRQAITRAIADHSATIRIPVHMIEKINKVNKAVRNLSQSLDREPTMDEIAQAIRMDPDKIRNIKRSMRPEPVSIDQNVGDDDRTTVGDFIADSENPGPLLATSQSLLREELEKALSILDEREEKILRLRFGLDRERFPRTLEEVGQHFRLTRERIRQIESKAIQKLKSSGHTAKLRPFIEEMLGSPWKR